MKRMHPALLLCILTSTLLLVGCPRFAYIELHNDTDADVSIYMAGEYIGVAEPNENLRFRAGHRDLEVQSHDAVWNYSLVIPLDGEDGPFFDGTLRLRLGENGLLEALLANPKSDEESPHTQPEGFPLLPALPNKGFNRTPESSGPAKPGEFGGGAG